MPFFLISTSLNSHPAEFAQGNYFPTKCLTHTGKKLIIENLSQKNAVPYILLLNLFVYEKAPSSSAGKRDGRQRLCTT